MTETDKTEVKKIAQAYITATFEGDVETLRKIFDQSAVMNGYLNGQLIMGGPEPFFEQMVANPSFKSTETPYKATIDHIYVTGNIGSVTINETGYGPLSFTNYLHLLKVNDDWKIVSKSFTGQ